MMTATAIAPAEERRRSVRHQFHPHCFACGEAVEGGLGLRFRVEPDGSVMADWVCPLVYRSYDGILHGGLIATLLDGAMVHALFARDVVARTAELRVRYRQAVHTGEPVRVSARLGTQFGRLYGLTAEVRQRDAVCATAQAKFMAVSP